MRNILEARQGWAEGMFGGWVARKLGTMCRTGIGAANPAPVWPLPTFGSRRRGYRLTQL